MFGFIKKILNKPSTETVAVASAAPVPIPIHVPISMPTQVPAPVVGPARANTAAPAPTVMPVAASAPAPAPAAKVIALPVATLLAALPAAVRSQVPADSLLFVSLPVEKILPQLAVGSVSLTLGELRAFAPEGLFGGVNGQEQTPVALPLGEILKQLNPALLPRRANQRRVEVPDEVSNIFGQKGQVLSISAPVKEEYRREPAPAAPEFKPVALPVPMPPPPVTPLSRPVPPAASALRPPAPLPWPASRPEPAAISAVRPAAPVSEVKPSAAPGVATLRVPLLSVCAGWPAEVRREIEQMNLEFASVVLPMEEAERALKSGQVIYPWKQLCVWIRPEQVRTPAAAVAELPVELPLSVLAPLFMALPRAGLPQKKVALNGDIPDVFSAAQSHVEVPVVATDLPTMTASFAFPSASAPAPVTAPAPMVAEVPLELVIPVAPAAPVVPSAPSALDLNVILGEPARRHSANQIVQNTTKLPGVNGALLAMNDGLLVASALPPDMKGELMAAFLPQIFGRMNQYTKELGLGGLQTLSFTVAGGSWQVFKSGGIFLAVTARPGEQLPFTPLAAIAAELGRQQE